MTTNETRRKGYLIIANQIDPSVAAAEDDELWTFLCDFQQKLRDTADTMGASPVPDVHESPLVAEVREKAPPDVPAPGDKAQLIMLLVKHKYAFVEANLDYPEYFSRLQRMVRLSEEAEKNPRCVICAGTPDSPRIVAGAFSGETHICGASFHREER